ncbi:hypothetical protein TCAL_16106 [Tigriopus californicus]|uniref:Uncharacterized protein n=2 Tax=Tigriopus californicus TaxID=6832 RepID=A0A553PNC3_TIGCA|nr:hypothetical protein TCAL_16106 [Tigriopus californicus]
MRLLAIILLPSVLAMKEDGMDWGPQYSSMSDVDWAKRGYDNWISPAYGYASMADSDWGWKKRGDPDQEPAHFGPIAQASTGPLRSFPSYAYRPFRPAVRRSPLTQDRLYGYHSMADLDWGWKKRSVNKRHIGSIGRSSNKMGGRLRRYA